MSEPKEVITSVNSDLQEEALEIIANRRFNRTQQIRENIVDILTEKLNETLADTDRSSLLLMTLRDLDNADAKRLTIKQEGKAQDSRERVLDLLATFTKMTHNNPFMVEQGTTYIPARPQSYHEGNDITDEEISPEDNPGNYDDFMKSRRNDF